MKRYHYLSKPVLPAILLATGLASPALAAGAAEAPAEAVTDPSDIVVTANRREEKLQRVPVSVAAATGNTLATLNIQRPEELTKLFAGFTSIPNAGSAVTSYNIRGVGQSDFGEHQEQPVAGYQDGVYVANAAATGFPIYDIQRVELLRGPQGTLFGRNATGGLVQFYSNQPKAGTSGYVTVTAGDYDLRRIEGAINMGSDTFAVRVAGYYSDRDGYIKNPLGRNLMAETVGALRAQFAWHPSADTAVTLRLEGFNSDGTSDESPTPSYYPAGSAYPALLPKDVDAYGTGAGKDFFGYRKPDDPYLQPVNDPGMIYKRSRTAALTIRHDLGEWSLNSITSWNHSKEAYREDSDGTPYNSFWYQDSADSQTISQELRVQKSTGRFRLTAGVYLFQVDGDYYAANNFPAFCDPTNQDFCSYATGLPLNETGKGATAASNYSLRTRSEAVFAQGEYDLTDKMTFILGGRYSWDQQRYNYAFTCTESIALGCYAIFGVGKHDGVVSQTGPITLRQNFGNWSGKATLNYSFTPDIMAYMSVNRGIKSSGFIFSYDGQLTPGQLSFLPEQLTSYEPGIKATLFNRKLTANLSLFHYDYHNFQTFQFSGVSAQILNRDAKSNGGELELGLRPGFGIEANFSAAYNNFWVKGINLPTGEVARQHPINAPRWILNWGLAKSFSLPDDLTLRLGYTGRYTGTRFYNVVNEDVVRAPGITMHDFDVTIEAKSGLSLKAYVNNFTNKTDITAAFDQTGQGFILYHYSMPRTYGLTAGYKF